jgi:hypothetical protein
MGGISVARRVSHIDVPGLGIGQRSPGHGKTHLVRQPRIQKAHSRFLVATIFRVPLGAMLYVGIEYPFE